MRHHTIVVSSFSEERIKCAQDKARSLFNRMLDEDDVQWGGMVSGALLSPVNGYWTFFIAPDGSKEGWSESERGEKLRAEFVRWLDEQRHSDGSSSIHWVEVMFADDDWKAEIVSHSNEKARRDKYNKERQR